MGHYEPGTLIAGKFRVERLIGEGGMGVVLAATHLQLDEPVALKFLRKEVTQPEIVSRFTQEARAAVKLKSEYVARTYDVGVEDGNPYIVMEYLDGHDLGQELEASGTLPIDVACNYMVQACAGVAEAHARGIVHRDIKPENIFVAARSDGSSVVKILDFGISHAVLAGGGPERESRRTTVLGSPFYISPEQLGTGSIDFRADIWSLGAVLFELLAGVRPFDAPDLTTLLRAISHEPPRKLSDYRPMVPQDLDAVIQKCLEKDPNARFQSAADLAVALLKFAPRSARVAADRATRVARAAGMPAASLPPSQAPPAIVSVQPAIERVSSPTPSGVATSHLPQAIEAPPKNRNAMWIGLGVALGAIALVVAVVSASQRGPAAPPPPKTVAATAAPTTDPPKPQADPIDTVQAVPPPTASAADSASARRPPPAPVAVPQWRPRPTQPAAAPPAAAPPSRPDLDIRMSR